METDDFATLVQLFCNYVNLGQWELAKGCLETLFNNAERNEDEILNLLAAVAVRPDAYR